MWSAEEGRGRRLGDCRTPSIEAVLLNPSCERLSPLVAEGGLRRTPAVPESDLSPNLHGLRNGGRQHRRSLFSRSIAVTCG